MWSNSQFKVWLVLICVLVTTLLIGSSRERVVARSFVWDKTLNSELNNVLDSLDSIEESSELLESGQLNCRFGLAISDRDFFDNQTPQDNWLDALGVGWYIDFHPIPSETPDSGLGSEHANLIRVGQKKDANGNRLNDFIVEPNLDELSFHVARNPGKLWLIGNEVDREGAQDDIYPQVYAKAFHDIQKAIRAADPTAQVAISALVQVTPGRLQYLDIVWDTYVSLYNEPMPVDVWNAHIYVLPEATRDGHPNNVASTALGTDISLATVMSDGTAGMCNDPTDNTYCFSEHDNMYMFKKQVIDMRRWMKDHGQQDKPLIITEYGILLPFFGSDGCKEDEKGNCFTQERVSEFMVKTVDWFETHENSSIGMPADGNKLVQQWLWFSNNTNGVGHASNLFKNGYANFDVGDPNALKLPGRTFADQISESELGVDLVIEEINAVHDFGRVELSVDVRNAGSTSLQDTVFVRFYSDEALTKQIGQAPITVNLAGCARASETVSVTWKPPRRGVNEFWVKIDATNLVGELSEGNNVGGSFVIASPSRVLLPIIDY